MLQVDKDGRLPAAALSPETKEAESEVGRRARGLRTEKAGKTLKDSERVTGILKCHGS